MSQNRRRPADTSRRIAMAEFRKALIVNTTPERAFEYLVDVARHPEWASNPLEIKKTSEGPIAVGTTFHSVGKLLGTHEGEVKIIELVPNEKIVYEANDDTARVRHTILLAPADGGTMITKASDIQEKRALTLKLAAPLLGIIAPRNLQQDLQKIKARLEA
jgi:uncharacterized protein YndB with AHSA1/START domain